MWFNKEDPPLAEMAGLCLFGPPPPALGIYGFASVRMSVCSYVRPLFLDLKICS